MIQDVANALVLYEAVAVPHASTGPLSGLSFVVKDLFDVAGHPTSAGHPAIEARLGVARRNADAVDRLLAAGARFVGKSITDELAFSLTGRNPHFGTPRNGGAPGRLPGGSSSGSASAVSSGLCDFALGTDTAGSVRLPASYQGLWGIRPTHGRVSLDRCVPLAPSFDTAGWFARSADVLERVGAALLDEDVAFIPASDIQVATDAFALVPGSLEPDLGVSATLAPMDLEAIVEAGRVLQAQEAWQTHKALPSQVLEQLSAPVRARLEAGRGVTATALSEARTIRSRVQKHLDRALVNGPILLPTVDHGAPSASSSEDELARVRNGALRLLYPASLAGVPQITMPARSVDGLPLGLSLIGPRGSDRSLIRLAAQIFPKVAL